MSDITFLYGVVVPQTWSGGYWRTQLTQQKDNCIVKTSDMIHSATNIIVIPCLQISFTEWRYRQGISGGTQLVPTSRAAQSMKDQ